MVEPKNIQLAFALILFASSIGLLPHVDLRCRPGDRNTITGAYLCAANTSADRLK